MKIVLLEGMERPGSSLTTAMDFSRFTGYQTTAHTQDILGFLMSFKNMKFSFPLLCFL